ncbi:hypothetical protein ACWED2_39745 [Amycolatopsis sp. NPDC005003]
MSPADEVTADESVVLAVVADSDDADPARLVRRLRRQLPRSGRSRKLDRGRLRELITASRP